MPLTSVAPPESIGLSASQRASARYLLQNASPDGEVWPYYRPLSEAGNFGTRFQMAFQAYAISALGERTPAYRTPTANALATLIERMFEPAIWRYWLLRGESLDPVGPHNVMYSGHLGQMIGCYERFRDDGRFDRPFLLDDGKASRHEHTHATVARSLASQMRSNECRGVTCEPGFIYVGCNHHSAIATLLYDNVHAEDLASPVEGWLHWMERRMLRPFGGVMNVAHITTYDRTIPISFRIMDAWGMAFLNAYGPDLFARMYPRWRRTVKRSGGRAWVQALPPNELLEIADAPLNTAFGYVAAREAGDAELASELEAFAVEKLDWSEGGASKACWSAKRRMMVSSLFSLGEALDVGDLRKSLSPRPAGFFDLPELVAVEGAEVEVAAWNENGDLVLRLADAGGEVRVECARVEPDRLTCLGGTVGDIQQSHGNMVARIAASGSVDIQWTRRGGLNTGGVRWDAAK